MKKTLLLISILFIFFGCNENVPSNNQELSDNDSLVLEMKTKLMGDSFTIWQDLGPNITTYSTNLKFKTDSVMILVAGMVGNKYNCIYYGEDNIPIISVNVKKYEIRVDEKGWNMYIKIGGDVGIIKYNENPSEIFHVDEEFTNDYSYKSSIDIKNKRYYKVKPQYKTIITYINKFIN